MSLTDSNTSAQRKLSTQRTSSKLTQTTILVSVATLPLGQFEHPATVDLRVYAKLFATRQICQVVKLRFVSCQWNILQVDLKNA